MKWMNAKLAAATLLVVLLADPLLAPAPALSQATALPLNPLDRGALAGLFAELAPPADQPAVAGEAAAANAPANEAGGGRRDATPKFGGVATYFDPQARFAVRHASDWRPFVVTMAPVVGQVPGPASDGSRAAPERLVARDGVGFLPDPADPQTSFSVWAARLSRPVTGQDVDALRVEVDVALSRLDGYAVEVAGECVVGEILRFERVYTFRDADGEAGESTGASALPAGGSGDDRGTNGAAAPPVHKRRQWLIYSGEWLIGVTWQGSTAEEYRYWLAMANYSFITFELLPGLWQPGDLMPGRDLGLDLV
jgi:hypothetical protein